jgi:hypothetical protein
VTFSAFAVAGEPQTNEIGQYRRSDISPGLRLDEIGKVFRHADVRTMLDASYLLDSRILSLDCRSLMVCLLPAARPLGSIWFASSRVGAFGPEDEATVLAIADLVAVALQHDRLFREERERRRRTGALEALLPTLSRALDVLVARKHPAVVSAETSEPEGGVPEPAEGAIPRLAGRAHV